MSKYYEFRDIESNQLRICANWGLYDPVHGGNPISQAEKTLEECGELLIALGKVAALKSVADAYPDAGKFKQLLDAAMAETKDAVGDVLVTLVNACALLDIDMIHDCYGPAVDVISKRTGRMIRGQFHKDE